MGFGKRMLELFVPDTHQGIKDRKHLTTISLACLIFFNVAGGPYGTEDAVGAVGAKYTLIGFIVLPLIWAIPEALITAEYSTAYPEATGGSAWAGAAFGPFWAWMSAWLAVVSGTVGLAAYPVMIVEYLALQWPNLNEGWVKVVLLVLITLVLFTANYTGLEVVGVAQVANAVFIMSPFLVLFFYCLPEWDTGKWGQVVKPADWETWINVMFWSLNYWSITANVAEEVVDPGRTVPRALMWAVVMVSAAYLLPYGMVTAVLTKDANSDWSVGFLGQAAKIVAGRGLMVWIIVASLFSAVGLFLSALTGASYLLHGLGNRGFLPRLFSHRGKFDTPTWAIWVQVIPVCLLVNLEFTALLAMINVTYGASMIISFGAALVLRLSAPDLPRPFRVPLNIFWLTLLLIPALGLILWILAIPFYLVQKDILYCLVGGFVIGLILWPLINLPSFRRLLRFNPLDLDWSRLPLGPQLPSAAKDPSPDNPTYPPPEPIKG